MLFSGPWGVFFYCLLIDNASIQSTKHRINKSFLPYAEFAGGLFLSNSVSLLLKGNDYCSEISSLGGKCSPSGSKELSRANYPRLEEAMEVVLPNW